MSGVPEKGIQHAIELGRQAVALDVEGKTDRAAYFYEEAASVLENLTALNISLPENWRNKATEYKSRASSLRNACISCFYFNEIILIHSLTKISQIKL